MVDPTKYDPYSLMWPPTYETFEEETYEEEQPKEPVDVEEQAFADKEPVEVKSWQEVYDSDEFQNLPFKDQNDAMFQYFDNYIAPQVNEEDISDARKQMVEFTGNLRKDEIPGPMRDAAQAFVIDPAKRTAGVALGALNSPLAFVWGMLEAPYLDPEEYNKMNTFDQSLFSVGTGLGSAFRSIMKEGDWGSNYGQYFKSVTGKTIKDTLPDHLKWADNTIEAVVNLISDPLFVAGPASQLAKLKGVPKSFVGNMPQSIIDDLARIEKLPAEDREVLTDLTEGAIKRREGYAQWWENEGIPAIREKKFFGDTKTYRVPTPENKQFINELAPYISPERQAAIDAGEAMKQNAATMVENKSMWNQFVNEAKDLRLAGDELYRKMIGAGTDPLKVYEGDVFDEIIKLEEELRDYQTRVLDRIVKVKNPTQLNNLEAIAEQMRTSTDDVVSKLAEAELRNFARLSKEDQIRILVEAGADPQTANVVADASRVIDENVLRPRVKVVPKGVPSKFVGDPDLERLYGMMGEVERPGTVSRILRDPTTKILDRFYAVKGFSPETYDKMRVFHSYKDKAYLDMRELQPVIDIANKEPDIVSGYIAAKRALVRADRGLQNPNNMTASNARNSIRKLEQSWIDSGRDVKELRNAATQFNDWARDKILNRALKSGIISKTTYDKILKENDFYATFDVIEKNLRNADSTDYPALSGREYFSAGRQDIVKATKGTEKLIEDPLTATIQKFTEAQALYERNDVARTLINDKTARQYMQPIAANPKQFSIMKNKGLNPVMEGKWDKNNFGIINAFDNGKVQKWIVPKGIEEAMKQLKPWQAPKIFHALGNIFRQTATTWNPAFIVKNPIRDAMVAWTTTPVYRAHQPHKFAKDWTKGFSEAAKFAFGKKSMVDDYIRDGGGFGYYGSEAIENSIERSVATPFGGSKIIRNAKQLKDKVADVLSIPELAPRLGIYDRAIKLGYDPKDAAMLGRMATIDFNRGGTYVKAINQFVPFLNARFQAKYIMGEALKRDPKQTLAKMFTTITLPGAGLYALNNLYFADEYKEVPKYVKDNYFVIMNGSKYDEETKKEVPSYFVIPKGDAGVVAWNPLEYSLDKLRGENKEAWDKLMIGILFETASNVSPVEFMQDDEFSVEKIAGQLLPPPVKALAEDWAGKRFWKGIPIVPRRLENKPPELQYTEQTPEVYRFIGQKLGVSPMRLQNYAQNLFTEYGRIGFNPASLGRSLQRSFYRVQGGAIEDSAWTAVTDIEQGYVTARAYAQQAVKEGNPSEARRIMNNWDRNLRGLVEKYNDEFGDTYLKDRGGIMKSYQFTDRKRQNIMMKKQQQGSVLERKLRR